MALSWSILGSKLRTLKYNIVALVFLVTGDTGREGVTDKESTAVDILISSAM